MSTHYTCPNCASTLDGTVSACGTCGMRLSGPQYQRLWTVLAQIGQLEAEAARLKTALLQPAKEAPAPAAVPVDYRPPVEAVAPRKSLSGQQVLLGMGALLVLAASSVFLIAVWLLVGVVGQALIMLGFTALAVQGGRVAARRGLDAAAETGAVIATGMALLDLAGARRFGLFGLDQVSPEVFGLLLSLVVAAALLAFDRLAPRKDREGNEARLPLVYVPVAAVLLALAPWFLLGALGLGFPGLPWLAGVLVVALVQAGTAAAVLATLGRRGRLPAYGLGIAAGLAYLLHVAAAFTMAHDIANSTTMRYGAFAFLLLPVAGVVVAQRRGLVPVWAPVAAVVVAATVPMADLRGVGVLVVSVGAAGVLAWTVLRCVPAMRIGAAVLLWMTAGTGLLLSLSSSTSLHRFHDEPFLDGSVLGVLVAVVPLALIALVAGWAAVRTLGSPEGTAWAVQVQAAVLLGTVRLLLETQGDKPWWAAGVGLLVVEAALAIWAARRAHVGVELGAGAFALPYAAIAVAAAGTISGPWAAATLVAIGALLSVCALSPGRFPLTGGAVLVSALGVGALVVDGEQDGSLLSVCLGTLPLLVTVGVALGQAVRTRDTGWTLVAQSSVALLALRLLLETDTIKAWWATAAALLVVQAALAMYAARRDLRGIELSAVGFGAAYAVAAVAEAGEISELWLAGTFFLIGAALIGWATSPGRFLVAYLAVAANAVGDWLLTQRAGVEVVEAYSLPVAAMLALVGFLHWRRDRDLPTLLTMGPALGVALLPSLVVAVSEGDLARLAGVTTAGVVALLVGYAQRWKAPVAWGGLTVAVLAITQGGPLVEHIPVWFTFGIAGAVLLFAGVRFEAAVQTGRRGAAWFGSLA